MIKQIKWFFIQLFQLNFRYSDIPNFDEDFENEMLILNAELIARRSINHD